MSVTNTYRRLTMLMNVMTTNLAHTAGLNPKGFRQIRQGKKDLRNASRGIVDGDLVFKYPDLPAPEKVHCQNYTLLLLMLAFKY